MNFKCNFINDCPDMERFEIGTDTKHKDLADQYEELCSVGGDGCSIREDLLNIDKHLPSIDPNKFYRFNLSRYTLPSHPFVLGKNLRKEIYKSGYSSKSLSHLEILGPFNYLSILKPNKNK